ncbi:DUF5779 family protein [Natronomonas sp. EA1]|uniref:DUF5779 family protein n=1 Tax=Natronomonas sp. EA1 TaxID=3421655 RepID=UPI003EBE4879
MADFDLDLQTAEGEMAAEIDPGDIVLGVLDGSTPPEEWVETIASGSVLVLHVDGDLAELAEGFAREVKDLGGELMHFRGFLVVAPPEMDIDTSRLG